MVKAAQKKVISIIVTGVLVILLATGLSIAFDEIYHSRKYPLNLDDWKTEPYAVLRYGKYQGIYRSDDTTFRSYTIKGIDKNDLIYM